MSGAPSGGLNVGAEALPPAAQPAALPTGAGWEWALYLSTDGRGCWVASMLRRAEQHGRQQGSVKAETAG